MRSITASILSLTFALVLLGANAASAEVKALVYEYEQSGQWNFKLLEENVVKRVGKI